MTTQDFRPAGEVTTDDRRRAPLTKVGAKPGQHYSAAVADDGRILLTPMALIPERELIVWENDELRASLLRGIEQARRGEVAEFDIDSLGGDEE